MKIVLSKQRGALLLIIFGVLSFVICGCSSLGSERLTKDQTARITDLARKKVLSATFLNLSDEERVLVTSRNPSLSYYPIAGLTYSDYAVTWALPSNGGLVVSGKGDVRTLEDAEIKRAQQDGESDS